MSASNLVLIDKAVTSQWVTTTCPDSRFFVHLAENTVSEWFNSDARWFF